MTPPSDSGPAATAPPRRGLAQWVILGLLALVLLLPGIAALPVTDRDEARFAQASRQMAVSGDWVDIRFQEEPRYKKPVGIYWLQAATLDLLGQGEDSRIWAHRLPSLLSTVLASMALAWAGAPVVGRRAALIAGGMLAATLLVQVEARLAKTDAALLLSTILVMGALIRARLEPQVAARTAAIFWTALGAGFLLKGPLILLPAGGLVLLLWALEGAPRWLARLRPLRGLLWAALLVVPWYAAILWVSDGGFLAASLGKDLGAKLVSGQESHGAPPGTYLLAVWATFWPWTVLLPLAAVWVWRSRRSLPARLLAGWLLPAWVLLELVPTKLAHYPLPLYPALLLAAAAAADGLLESGDRLRGWAGWIGVVAWGMIALVFAGVVAAGPVQYGAGLDPAALLGALAALAIGGAGIWLLLTGRIATALGALGLSGAAMLGTALAVSAPSMDRLWVSERLAAAMQAQPCLSGPVALAGYNEPSAVFLLGKDTILSDPDSARALLAEGGAGAAWIADPRGKPADGIEGLTQVSGFNYSRGKPVRLRLYLPPGEPAQAGACPPSG